MMYPKKIKMIFSTATSGYSIAKRILDIFLSAVGILVCIPLFLFIAFLIKWDDRHSPVFFSQIRVGKDEKTFKMYKFRTMIPNAEKELQNLLQYNEVKGKMFKMKNDPRITPIGKFLRNSSLDELPQLINVLKGEMSLVGPRPCLLSEFEKYTDFEKKRVEVIPGCTGLWQISGRNSLSFKQMIYLDMEYIKRRNLWMDIKILLKTPIKVFKKENAY